ncbi:MAG: beta-galactosidase [Patescibacteria group bacterium]
MIFVKRKKTVIFVILCIALILYVFLLLRQAPIKNVQAYGITFSSFYAEQFGLDWKKTYLALFDDLGVRHLRIPAYWNEIEKEQGKFDFSRLDWQIEEANRHNAEIILAVGRKLPRWPECHDPEWANSLIDNDKNKFNANLLNYIKSTVERYRNNNAVKVWQIENEPYLPFGECKKYSIAMLDQEISLVKSLDSTRPIMISDSGELSIWIRAANRADIFGSTMYRTVHNKFFGTITYPLPPSFFRLKRAITELFVGKKPMIVVELQGEPWSREATYKISVDDHYKTMNPDIFRGILTYASQSGFDTFYLWGVEWWYWLKETQGEPEIWNTAKEAIKNTKQ